MKYCQRCGAAMNDTDQFCTNCGQQYSPYQPMWQPAYPNPQYQPVQNVKQAVLPKKRNKALLYFILGLLLFIVINPLGTPFSAVGVIYAAIANSADCEYPDDKLEKSRIFLVAAAIIDAFTILICASLLIFKNLWR